MAGGAGMTCRRVMDGVFRGPLACLRGGPGGPWVRETSLLVDRMQRRNWLATVLAVAAGCSGGRANSPLDRLPAGAAAARKRGKGPQTMGGILLDSYVKDLASPDAAKRIKAAEELANMGGDAKKAVPALERLAGDKDAKVSAAARRALGAITKR